MPVYVLCPAHQRVCACACMHECVCVPVRVGLQGCLCVRTDPICLVAGHSLGKCVQAKNSHTAQRSNYEPPLRDREVGRGGWTRG